MSFEGECVFQMSMRLKLIIVVLLTIAIPGLVCGYTLWTRHALNPVSSSHVYGTQPSSRTTITIPRLQDLFVPFLLVVPLYATVTWQNDDIVGHLVVTTAQADKFLNQQALSLYTPAGQRIQFTFSRPGLYHYYDPTWSTWNSGLARVAANRGTPHFPLAMDGVIWVQGHISGLPTAAINHIPAGHDDFASEFLAINQPGGVTWHNFDGDAHFVGLVEGWSSPVNPVDIGLYRIAGTGEVSGGATVTILFNVPGLYYYYCRNHDQVDPLTHRAQAKPVASEYPIPMEGFVLVLA
jgi:plastocyanin